MQLMLGNDLLYRKLHTALLSPSSVLQSKGFHFIVFNYWQVLEDSSSSLYHGWYGPVYIRSLDLLTKSALSICVSCPFWTVFIHVRRGDQEFHLILNEF